MKKLFICVLFISAITPVLAQRVTDLLDRGLVAVPSGSGSFVSWRIFGEEYYDTEYNLYRDGELVAGPLKVSNYTDPNGKAGSTYQVSAVVRGVEQDKCNAVTRLNQQYIEFPVQDLYSRTGENITSGFSINDIALADVDGDGVSEFIMKRNYVDGSSVENTTSFNHLECYNLQGERLWYIDLGPNMVSGPDEQYDAVGYDWDGDGKAEILLRGADNMIIHCKDGSSVNIGNMNVNTRNTVLQTANMTYTNTGAEYLLYLDGATGMPYEIGSGSTPYWIAYPLPRGNVNDWGDGYGHRATKHYFGAPCLDGRNAFIFLGRGCYTKHHMKAFSVNPTTHKLSLYWEWSNNGGWSDPWYANGFHNFGIADVDWDGRDEICFGSMVIDDNGKGLSTTGLGHGDAQHCSDFDPYRHGQEIFTCNEDEPAMNYRDATTSKIYYRLQSSSDDGRALCGNFSNDYPGAIGHSSQSGTVSCVSDKVIDGGPTGFTNNFRIYWDGDLLEEGLDGASSREGAARVFKANGSIVFTADGTANCNWTKNTPSATGDILGDWREEIIVRTSDNKYVRVYTTNIATSYRNYTLWHDHQYRQGMVWESIGYNQPPHASYFLGELEGITVAPPPLTMTGRTEVGNNGSIDASVNDKHVLVCETNDTQISVAEGASPYMVTFNVPSWVQGTNSNKTDGSAVINYTYYTCNVTGAAFTGNMRLVKQGDGILNLPKVDNTYSGETNIWAGTLNFDGTMRNSDLWLNRFAVLNSDGGVFHSLKADYASVVRPGGIGKIGTIQVVEGYKMGFGSRLVLELQSNGTEYQADQIKGQTLTIESKNWKYGPQYLTPVIELASADGTAIQAGEYVIGEFSAIEGSLANVKIEGAGAYKAGLKFENGQLILTLGSVRGASHITWTGNKGSVWDYANTENFVLAGDETATPEIFVAGDIVDFTDAASVHNVTIQDEMTVDSLRVNNTEAYTFSGNGRIVEGAFVKEGSGSVTMSNDNTYTGGTYLRGGTTIVSSMASATQAFGALGAPVSSAAKFVLSNGAVLKTTATIQNYSAMRMTTAEGGVLENTAAFTQQRAMQGTLLTKCGAGALTLSVDNGGLSKLVLSAGSIYASTGTPALSLELNAGSLTLAAASSVPLVVPEGKTAIVYYPGDRLTYSNALSGAGTVTFYYPVVKGSGWYATRTALNGNWSAFEGTVRPAVYTADDGRFCINNSYGLPKGTLSIPQGVVVQSTAKTFAIGELIGAGSLGGTCSLSSSSAGSWSTWNVGSKGTDFTFAGKITANAVFNKVGEGIMTVSGTWDNTGTVTVREGTLKVSTATTLGTGNLVVAEGARLAGNISTGALKNATVTVNGTLQPGISDILAIGKILLNSQKVTVGETGTLRFGISKASTGSTVLSGTSLQNIGTLSFASGATISLFIVGNYVPQAGDEIRLFTNVSNISGTPTVTIDGYEVQADMTRFETEGVIVLQGAVSGLNQVETEKNTEKEVYLDLVGRRVYQPTKGIYIKNGKKVLIE